MSRTPSPSMARYGQSSSAAGGSQSDIDALESARQSPVQTQHQDRRYHATNTLYRSPSAASGNYVDIASHSAVDTEMAQGLAEDVQSPAARSVSRVSRNDDGTGTFLPAREGTRTGVTGSILPPAAFFSPKRPPQSASPSALMSPSASNPDSHNRGQQAFVINSSADSDQTQANTVPRKTSMSTIAASNPPIRLQQFAPHRPAMHRPPPNSDPATLAQKKAPRNYKKHRGANRFFVFGLIMTSDDNPLPFIASLLVMIALPVLWLVFVAPYTWRHVSPAPVVLFAYLFSVALTSMCVTAWRDPGVLPRGLDPDPPCTAGVDGGYVDTSDPLAIPLPRVIRVRNNTDLKVKWCDTCGTYRPPRSSHCRVCDNCVENIDHHCTFLNTCIGRRNYFTFFAFLVFSIAGCLFAIAFCVLRIYYLTVSPQTALPRGGFGEGKTFREALQATPVSALLFFLFIGVVAPMIVLFSYHVRLICFNRTTVEQIRINATHAYSEKPSYDDEEGGDGHGHGRHAPPGRMHQRFAACLPCLDLGIPGRDPNPFAHQSMLRNACAALLRPMTAHSWIDRYRPAHVDDRRPNPASANTPVAIV